MSVLQPWVERLSFMQQSVLIAAVRAPDTLRKDHPAKQLMRWYRRSILICAFEKIVHVTPDEPCGGKFTGPIVDALRLRDEYLHNVDEIPHHFHLHLLHAAEIIAYRHPDPGISRWWRDFYTLGVNDMHVRPESVSEMMIRLSDDETAWKERENFPART